jgi:hypothetical protein
MQRMATATARTTNHTASPDQVEQDLPHVLGFLLALEAGLPGTVPAELTDYLKLCQGNATALRSLAKHMGAV